jgi:putative hydrolase of the HAD superfamily
MHTPEVLIFDLGGVLIDFSAFEDLRPLLRQNMQPEEIRQRWISCPHIQLFEIGQLTSREFAELFVRDWDVIVSPDRFLVEFRSWTRGFIPGARSLLRSLRNYYRLAALSNSNATHWDCNVSEHGLLDLFDSAFSSHELGWHKPDPRIYREALKRLGISANKSVFFDDSLPNVQSAQALGMSAFHVNGVSQVRQCLIELGLSLD